MTRSLQAVNPHRSQNDRHRALPHQRRAVDRLAPHEHRHVLQVIRLPHHLASVALQRDYHRTRLALQGVFLGLECVDIFLLLPQDPRLRLGWG